MLEAVVHVGYSEPWHYEIQCRIDSHGVLKLYAQKSLQLGGHILSSVGLIPIYFHADTLFNQKRQRRSFQTLTKKNRCHNSSERTCGM